jgi:hypothetical protein
MDEAVESKCTDEIKIMMYVINFILQFCLVLVAGTFFLDALFSNQLLFWPVFITTGLLASLLAGFVIRFLSLGAPWPTRFNALFDHSLQYVWRRSTWMDLLQGIPRMDLGYNLVGLGFLSLWFHAPLNLLILIGSIRIGLVVALECRPEWMLYLVPPFIEEPGQELEH